MIQLSVIVPVFRTEQYLEKCVSCLLQQDLEPRDYEIILVDDGSDDNSPAICDRYAALYTQVHVIHQSNKGLSGARNTGIRAAKGKYICFVDSDDYVEPNCFASLINIAENNTLDLLRYGLQVVRDNRTISIHTNNDKQIYTGEQFLQNHMSERCSCGIYLIRKELIIETETYFTEGITYEDIDWTPRIILQAKRIQQVSTIVYNYVQHESSITHQKTIAGWQHIIENNLHVLTRLQQTVQNAPRCQEWFDSMCSSIITAVLTIVAKHLYSERKEYITRIKTLYPNTIRCKSSFSNTERIKAALANMSLNIYCTIRHYL